MRRPEAAELVLLQASVLGDLTGLRVLSPAERAAILSPPSQGTLERRWEIYTSGYIARLAEALENDFPATRRILGEAPFRSLTARYVSRCPPRSYDIGRAGDRLAQFLRQDPLTADLPFLPDLARFEWSLAEAFVARDVEPLEWSELATLDPETVADTVFHLRPATTLIRSCYPLLELWAVQELDDADVSVTLEARPSAVLVRRHGLEVRRHVLAEDDAGFLEAAANGLRLAELTDSTTGEQAAALVRRFRFWVGEGLFEKPGRRTLRRPL